MSKASSKIYIPSKQIKPEDITIDTLQSLGSDSFAMWTQTTGVEVDSNPVDFHEHRYLLPIYLDNSNYIVWQKAAQLGATVYMLLRILWWLSKNQGRKAGLYFPTKEGADNLSSDRLDPIIDSCPPISRLHDKGSKLSLRKFGKSSFYIYHLGGVASKDSVPLDLIAFDEVRLCSPKDVDQALERISHSKHKYRMFISTCGLPNTDINARFLGGTQHIWMSKCNCSDGIDLARTFPACVVDDPKRGLHLRCPKCGWQIKDPQNGRYVSHNPGADYHSYRVSQLASKFISLQEIWDFYKRTTNMQEFYNAKLGIPYIDEENRGVGKDELEACVNPSLSWSETSGQTAMGVDQGGGYVMAVIADFNKDRTKKRIRHIEIIERNNPQYYQNGKQCSPFVRLRELMKEYKVGICVVDGMPNYDEALAFAQDFPGKVYTGWYNKDQKDVVVWGDKKRTREGVRKAGKMFKFKYHVIINRFTSMSAALGAFRTQDVEVPNPDGLIAVCRDEGTSQLIPQNICRDRFFNHLLRLVKRFKVTNEETGEGRWEWIYASGDPHLAHAWNYCNVALERLRRQAIWVFA